MLKFLPFALAFAAAACADVPSAPTAAVNPYVPVAAVPMGFDPGGGLVTLPAHTFQARKWYHIIRQRYDFSCGAAATATLLTWHYQHPVSEREVFDAMMQGGNPDQIRAKGFSLLDIQHYLGREGFEAHGYRVGLDRLLKAGVPAIALINANGYTHFVLIRGIGPGIVLIADSARGNRTLPFGDFQKIWSGVVFVITSKEGMGRSHFNVYEDWMTVPSAPDRAFDIRLSPSVGLPNPNTF